MTTLLAMMTPSPSAQSCATCTTAISRQLAPTRVTPAARSPCRDGSCSAHGSACRRRFRTASARPCISDPAAASRRWRRGNRIAPAPIRVWPSTTTWETRRTPSSSTDIRRRHGTRGRSRHLGQGRRRPRRSPPDGSRSRCHAIHDHGGKGRFRDGSSIDPRHGLELPDIAAVTLLRSHGHASGRPAPPAGGISRLPPT